MAAGSFPGPKELLIKWGIDSYSALVTLACVKNKTFEHFRFPGIKQSKYHPSASDNSLEHFRLNCQEFPQVLQVQTLGVITY